MTHDLPGDVLRPHAEEEFAHELVALARTDTHHRPPMWRLSPWAVVTYLVGGTLPDGTAVALYPVLTWQPLTLGEADIPRGPVTPIACDTALAIARTDAERVYDQLNRFRVEVQLEADGWHVDFRLKAKIVAGGGPHYIIDSESGVILHKRYEQ